LAFERKQEETVERLESFDGNYPAVKDNRCATYFIGSAGTDFEKTWSPPHLLS